MKKEELIVELEKRLSTIFEGDKKIMVQNMLHILIEKYERKGFKKVPALDETRAYMITYGDSFYKGHCESTLQTLKQFCDDNLKGIISDVHILPMFPYSSDDGFSVIDYMKIDEKLGDWTNIKELEKNFHLMFDFVANHISKESDWFQSFLKKTPGFENMFIRQSKDFDVSNVTRPRTTPLFHTYNSISGKESVWTTFSEDQIDLNFEDPQTFIRMTEILLEYCSRGASSIRLDAIGFMWKESGTTCMSLPQTHKIIEIWRLLTNYFAPNTQIITETNIPHEENISYFGDGTCEASQVYQFALPPLILHTFTSGNAKKLSTWASQIKAPSQSATYFNFLASHDGIGMRPVESILNEDEKQILVDKVIKNGGRVSYKTNTDGTKSVYELNINYADALRNEEEDDTLLAKKSLAAHAILMSLVGVPAIYYHSLVGSHNDIKGMQTSGIARRINREKLDLDLLYKELENDEFRMNIYNGMKHMLQVRKQERAFYPYGAQKVIALDERVFSIQREYKNHVVYIYVNVSDEAVELNIEDGYELLHGQSMYGNIKLEPYDVLWIRK